MSLHINSLTVSGFRGIAETRTFSFEGEDVVIVGPNGSGKSTILQAIEFLCTGRIEALRGSGTGRISRNKHVPNRSVDPDNTFVQATVEIDGEPITLRREYTRSSSLQADSRPSELDTFLEVAENGLLHLTRDELLRLIITTPGQRKDEIQELLDLDGIDEKRRQLKRLKRECDTEIDSIRENKTSAESHLTDALDIKTVSDTSIRQGVNAIREDLGGQPIDSLSAVDSFREGINSPVEQAAHPLSRSDTKDRVATIRQWFESDLNTIENKLDELQAEIEVLLADKDLISEVSELSLVRQGRSLVKPFTNECPLCKSPFAQGELESKLEEREQRLYQVDERTDSVNEMAQEIHTMLEEVRAEINHLIETLRESAVDAQLRPLASYHYQLDELQSDLQTDIVDNIKSVDESTFDVDLYDEEAESVITELADIAANRPERSQLEAQWDALKSATDNYELWIDAKTRLAAAEDAYSEFDTAYDEFIAARDEILSEVYEEISDLFITFYTTINPDESDIDSILSPTNTGIQFNIEFDGKGDHPPHALHSEGHQDSMGVCLFLALADHFSPLKRMPLLLDDVVMSIDDTHRQRVAEMFENELPDRFQLFMTTHDRDWARQLVDSGVVDESNVVNFDDRDLNDASGIPATND